MKEDDYVAQLIISKGKQVINTFKITADDKLLTIGLLPINDIVLQDDKRYVSRIHAAIIQLVSDNGPSASITTEEKKIRYFIRDLGSTHGTKIGGDYVHKKILEDGDKIRIADYTLVFRQSYGSEDKVAGLPLQKLYGQLPQKHNNKLPTEYKAGKKTGEKLTMEQQEFLSNISKTGLGSDLLDKPEEFISHLLSLIRAEKAIVGSYKNGTTSITYQKGLDRERPHCDDEFLSQLYIEGPIRQEGALWIPLNKDGFIGLFRTMHPAFEENDMQFMRLVCDKLLDLQAHGREFNQYTPWPVSIVGLKDVVGKCLEIAKMVKDKKTENKDQNDIIITGETGSGKSAIARFIHDHSSRRNGPFITVNCGAIPSGIASSEFFGYEKGAFNEAKVAKPGFFEIAKGGTLFLDEIGDMPESIQSSLLTALKDRKAIRLGGKEEYEIDVLVIAATDRDIDKKMLDDSFRRALYERFTYRLHIPPIRERLEDIPLLAYYYLDKISEKKNTRAFSREAMQRLRDYQWPGNIHEMQQVISNATLSGKEVIFSWDIDPKIKHAKNIEQSNKKIFNTLKESEKEQIMEALEETRGNKEDAAALLGKSRATIYNKIEEYGIPKYYGKIK